MTARSPSSADKFEGKRLNSPNDVVVKSDGSIWFTDPQFGILSNYEGEIAEPELPMNVYRVDGKTGALSVVADGINAPNGLAFSPDEKKLYIVESRSEPRRILTYDVAASGDKISRRQGADRCRPQRHAGRLPRRCRRQSVVRLGHDGRSSTAFACSARRVSRLATFHCRSAAPMSASAAGTAIACSWRRRIRSIRST